MTEQPPHDDSATAETRTMPAGDPPPVGDPPPARRFLRSRDDRYLLGVCGGLGRHLGVDATLLRLAFVVLALFGGAGVLLYLAAVLLVPDAPPGAAGAAGAAAGPPADRNRVLTAIGVLAVLVVAGPVLFVPGMVVVGLAVPLATLVVLGVGAAWLVTGRRPDRSAGAVVMATLLGLGVLALLAVLAAGAFWTAGLGGEVAVAAIVIVAGVALLAGAFVRPVRWLVLPALAVAIPAAFVAAAGIDLDGGVGDKTFRPGVAADVADRYSLGAGQLTVDLRDTELPAGDHRVALRVGMGEATLLVPEDVCVTTDAQVGMGAVALFDRDSGGVDVDVQDRASAPAGTTRLVVDADVGLGAVQVRHTDERAWQRAGWDADRAGSGPDEDGPGNEACAGAG